MCPERKNVELSSGAWGSQAASAFQAQTARKAWFGVFGEKKKKKIKLNSFAEIQAFPNFSTSCVARFQ